MTVRTVPIEKLRIDGGIQSRARIDPDTVREYAEAIAGGAKRKEGPIVAFDDGEYLWVASGFTWLAAERMQHTKEIEVDVLRGTQRDALLHSAGCNSDHGKRRTPEDKRHAVSLLLADPEWAKASDRWIAEQCRVSHTLVTAVRPPKEQQEESDSTATSSSSNNQGESKEEKRTGKDGKKRQARKPKPKQEEDTEGSSEEEGDASENAHEETKQDLILCDRCQRVAPGKGIADCAACDALRKGKKPSANGEAGKKSTQRNGTESFDWNRFDNLYGPIVRFQDEVARAFPDQKGSSEYYAYERALEALLQAVKAWKKKTARSHK